MEYVYNTSVLPEARGNHACITSGTYAMDGKHIERNIYMHWCFSPKSSQLSVKTIALIHRICTISPESSTTKSDT